MDSDRRTEFLRRAGTHYGAHGTASDDSPWSRHGPAHPLTDSLSLIALRAPRQSGVLVAVFLDQLAGDDHALNPARSSPDFADLRVAHHPPHGIVLRVAVPAVDL